MKKVAIHVEETLKYDGEIVVIQPESMSDTDFDNLIDKAEAHTSRFNAGIEGLVDSLGKLGLKVEEVTTSSPNSPSSSEFEIVDVYNKK